MNHCSNFHEIRDISKFDVNDFIEQRRDKLLLIRRRHEAWQSSVKTIKIKQLFTTICYTNTASRPVHSAPDRSGDK